MKVSVLRVLDGLLVAIVLVQAPSPSQGDWQWLSEHREAALEAFMPIVKSDKILVTYQSFRDLYHDVEERYFSISFAAGPSFNRDRLEATVVIPAGKSIQQQILDLHMRNRAAPFESLVSQVLVRRALLDAERCPALRVRLDALSKTVVLLPKRDTISIHPFIHRIMIDMSEAKIDATLHNDENPVIIWARDTFNALLACASRR